MPPPPANLRLLIVDDDTALRQSLGRRFERQGMTVTDAGTGADALEKAARHRCDVALLDLNLPDMDGIELLRRLKERQPDLEAIMLTAHGSIETAIRALKCGAYDYLTKPFHLPELEIHLQKAYEKQRLSRRQRQWVDQVAYESARHQLIGSSPSMRQVVSLIRKVAPTDATVLVLGASGTGKELVAQAIHYNSPRRERPIVTVNCAALQETLLESELFGHEKGAFTDALQAKPGLIEVAEGGTLFIDEVAETQPGLQAKLLRVLEDGHYRRVGGTQECTADVRVLAATSRALDDEMRANRFREDLYYRLNVVTIALPPLRERRSDIPELITHFLATRALGSAKVRIAAEAMNALIHHDWPGNVRELANVLERAQILVEDNVITLADLPEDIVAAAPPQLANGSDPRHLSEVERRHVVHVLRQEKGNKVHAAKVLGISRRALYRLISKHHLEDRINPQAGDSQPPLAQLTR